MAVRTVLELGHPNLRKIAAAVDPGDPSLESVLTDLADTLAHWRQETGYGRAIAAPQIDCPIRVIFVNVDRPWPLLNPEIIYRSPERKLVWDGCLSFLFLFLEVERHFEVGVRYQDLEGSVCELKTGQDFALSELLQHEIDHLDGILAVDHLRDTQRVCSRREFEERYRAESPYAVEGG